MKKLFRTSVLQILIVGIIILQASSCKKKHEPEVSTVQVNNVTISTAIIAIEVNSDGGSEVTEAGVCWSANNDPTIEDNIVTGDLSGGSRCKIRGLATNSTYYARAYAKNKKGTAYGETKSFKTGVKNEGTIKDIEGNVYNFRKIGDYVWLQENLKVKHYRNGDMIPRSDENQNVSYGAYMDYANDSVNSLTYGKLYNWMAVNDNRGLAPLGWHVATDEEWSNLVNSTGDEENSAECLRESGGALWKEDSPPSDNETGFSALPGGGCIVIGYYGIGYNARWWTSTPNGSDQAWHRSMHGGVRKDVLRINYPIKCALSIRCVKDH